jgi:hypothetical protein
MNGRTAATTSIERRKRGWKRLHAPSGRATNLTLLVALLLAFATGTGAVATGSARGRWVVIAHGIVGLAVILRSMTRFPTSTRTGGNSRSWTAPGGTR